MTAGLHRNWLYIWVVLLCVGIVMQSVLAVYVLHEARLRQARDLALVKHNQEELESQQQTIRLLCDRGYITGDLILAAIDIVKAQNPRPAGSAAFLRQYNLSYNQTIDEFTRPGSPCVG